MSKLKRIFKVEVFYEGMKGIMKMMTLKNEKLMVEVLELILFISNDDMEFTIKLMNFGLINKVMSIFLNSENYDLLCIRILGNFCRYKNFK
jgi:hypothetical protein